MRNKFSSRLLSCTNTMDRDEDTLSFASLVRPDVDFGKSPALAKHPKQHLSRPSFEFPWEQTPPISSPADLPFANGSVASQNTSPMDPEGHSGRRRCLKNGNGWRSADSVAKRVSFQEDVLGPKRPVASPMPERRNEKVGGRGAVKSKGKGLFGSIFSGCRECRAMEPSKRVGDVAN